MSSAPSLNRPQIARVQRQCLVAGAVGLALCAIGAFFDPEQFFRSYLLAYVCWLGIALGSLAIRMIHHLTGGMWGLMIRRFLEAALGTFPLLVVLFVPIACGLSWIYPWMDPEVARGLGPRVDYLNSTFFLIRAGVYLAIWLVWALILNFCSSARDRTGDVRFEERAAQFSGPGLVLYGLTVTFASVDWIMSLEPEWYSTIFGAIVATAQLLPALALAIALATWFTPRTAEGDEADAPVWNDLGNLLLAFVMLWTYMAFSQFLLIWSGNLPEEIVWYLARSEGGWQWIAGLLAVLYFALPFMVLLSRDVKRKPEFLRVIALLLIAMSFVYHYWLIVPSYSPGQIYLHWMDLAALVGVGGLWFALALWQLERRPAARRPNPVTQESLSHV